MIGHELHTCWTVRREEFQSAEITVLFDRVLKAVVLSYGTQTMVLSREEALHLAAMLMVQADHA